MVYNPVWSWQFFYTTFCVIIPVVSFALLARFYYLTWLSAIQLSTQLKIHLIAWLLSLAFGLSFFAPQMQDFIPPGEYFD